MAASNWPLSSKLWQIYKFLIFVLVFVSRDLEHQLWRVNRQSCAGLIFLNTEEPLRIIVGLYRPHVFHVFEPTASEYWKNLCKLSPLSAVDPPTWLSQGVQRDSHRTPMSSGVWPLYLNNSHSLPLIFYSSNSLSHLSESSHIDDLKILIKFLLLARLHKVQGARLVTVAGVCCRLSSSSVTSHSGPAGGFTRTGQAITSCRLQSNYSSTAARRASSVTSR